MNLIDAIASGFKKYTTFSGRATRSEFWYWQLFVFLVTILLKVIDHSNSDNLDFSQPGTLETIFTLGTLLPGLAVFVRRMHDVDRSGWWFFIAFTIIGAIFPLLVWECTEGTVGDNRFGPDPLRTTATV